MGRSIEFDKNKISQEILFLFWEKGFYSTSLQDILNKTGLNKSSLYNSFGKKEATFLHIFQLYNENILHRAKIKEKGIKFISNFFKDLVHFEKNPKVPSGCMAWNAIYEFRELADSDPKRQLAQEVWSSIESNFYQSLETVSNEKEKWNIDTEVKWLSSQVFAIRALAKLKEYDYCDEVVKRVELHLSTLE